MEAKRRNKFGDSVDSNLVAGDCDVRPGDHILKELEGSECQRNTLHLSDRFLAWDKNGQIRRLQNQYLLQRTIDCIRGVLQPPDYRRAFFPEGLMVFCFQGSSMTQFHPALRFVSTRYCLRAIFG